MSIYNIFLVHLLNIRQTETKFRNIPVRYQNHRLTSPIYHVFWSKNEAKIAYLYPPAAPSAGHPWPGVVILARFARLTLVD